MTTTPSSPTPTSPVDDGGPAERLGRFGHHPDPAIDFCVEVEVIEGEWLNIQIGFENGTPSVEDLFKRVDKAMTFRVGGDENAVNAKQVLRKIEREMSALLTARKGGGERV